MDRPRQGTTGNHGQAEREAGPNENDEAEPLDQVRRLKRTGTGLKRDLSGQNITVRQPTIRRHIFPTPDARLREVLHDLHTVQELVDLEGDPSLIQSQLHELLDRPFTQLAIPILEEFRAHLTRQALHLTFQRPIPTGRILDDAFSDDPGRAVRHLCERLVRDRPEEGVRESEESEESQRDPRLEGDHEPGGRRLLACRVTDHQPSAHPEREKEAQIENHQQSRTRDTEWDRGQVHDVVRVVCALIRELEPHLHLPSAPGTNSLGAARSSRLTVREGQNREWVVPPVGNAAKERPQRGTPRARRKRRRDRNDHPIS